MRDEPQGARTLVPRGFGVIITIELPNLVPVMPLGIALVLSVDLIAQKLMVSRNGATKAAGPRRPPAFAAGVPG